MGKRFDCGVDDCFLAVMKDVYQEAKSCVEAGYIGSDYFQCYSYVRQKGNQSLVLFAIYVNDIQSCMAERTEGPSSLGRESSRIGWKNEDESLMLKMLSCFMQITLLYVGYG